MAVWLAVMSVLTAVPPELTSAETAMSKYKYSEALVLLKKAKLTKNLDRVSRLRILELQGIAYGQQRQGAQSVSAFSELLTLNPSHRLSRDLAPRVTTPFLEAKQAVAEGGPLELSARPPDFVGSRVSGLSVEISKDRLKLAQTVLFHVNEGTTFRDRRVALRGGKASISVDADKVSWWAELLGDNGAQLALLGSEAEPLSALPPPPLVDVPVPNLSPTEPADSAVTTSTPTRKSSSALLPIGIVFGGAAVAAAVTGGFFGLRSSSTLRSISEASAMKDAQGNIVGITQKEAAERGKSAATDGLVANSLWIGAGALAATAVVLLIVHALPNKSSSVALSVTPNGGVLVFSGTFP